MNLRKDHYRASGRRVPTASQTLAEAPVLRRRGPVRIPPPPPCPAPLRGTAGGGALVSESLSQPASGPAGDCSGGTQSPGPAARRGPLSGTQRPRALLRGARGGFNVPGVVPRAPTGDGRRPRGARGSRRLGTPTCLPLESSGSSQTKQRVQLLAVDHSARASMKNAASCEK